MFKNYKKSAMTDFVLPLNLKSCVYPIYEACDKLRYFTTYSDQSSLNGFRTLQDLIAFQKMLNVNGYSVTWLKQIHSDRIVDINQSVNGQSSEGDAMICSVKNQVILIKTADCVPVMVYDERLNLISVIHSGWRGTFKEISKKTILRMKSSYGSRAADLKVVIGPSIGPKNYEVGKDVYAKFSVYGTSYASCFLAISESKFLMNLWEAIRIQLIACDIPEENIAFSKLCTYSNSSKFYSVRKQGMETGRILSGLVMI